MKRGGLRYDEAQFRTMQSRGLAREVKPLRPLKDFGRRACAGCGVEFQKRNGLHTYCDPCSNGRADSRRDAWEAANPDWRQDPAAALAMRERARSTIANNGLAISSTDRPSLTEPIYQPDLAWYARVRVPFTYAASKNAVYRLGIGQRIFMRAEAKQIRDQIIAQLVAVVDRTKVRNNKVWLDLFVQKPDHRGDAVNVVDLVCDAVKVALDVDDRWYSLRSLDWQVTKQQPYMYIGVGQEECEDAQICSSCGRTLALGHFTKKASSTHGVNRNCRECRGVLSLELPL